MTDIAERLPRSSADQVTQTSSRASRDLIWSTAQATAEGAARQAHRGLNSGRKLSFRRRMEPGDRQAGQRPDRWGRADARSPASDPRKVACAGVAGDPETLGDWPLLASASRPCLRCEGPGKAFADAMSSRSRRVAFIVRAITPPRQAAPFRCAVFGADAPPSRTGLTAMVGPTESWLSLSGDARRPSAGSANHYEGRAR